MVSVGGDLLTLTVPNAGREERFKLACPTCRTPTSLKQGYTCEKGHGPFSISECDRMHENDEGAMVKVTADEASEASASILPDRELALQVHLRDEIIARTYPSGNAYLFRPKGTAPLYGILLDILAERPDIALVAKTNLRHNDKFVQVDRGLNGQLIVRELIWPQDMKQFEAPEYAYDPKYRKQALDLIEASVEPFDPEQYRRDAADRIAAIVAEATGSQPKQTSRRKKNEDDLGDSLLTAIEVAKKKKAS